MTIQELATLDPQYGDGWHVGNEHDSGELVSDMPCDVCGEREQWDSEDCTPKIYTFSKLNKGFCRDCLTEAMIANAKAASA